MSAQTLLYCVVIATAVSCGSATSASAATNLVQNPGFELGTGGGWSENTGIGVSGTAHAIVPEAGSLMASIGCSPNPSLPCQIFQVLPTIAGQAYTLAFGFNTGGGAGSAAGYDYVRLQVEWDGGVIADLGGGPLGWTDHSYAALVASSNTTTLRFRGYSFPVAAIDNVSVVKDAVAVPEPATWALMISGMGLAGVALRHRRATSPQV